MSVTGYKFGVGNSLPTIGKICSSIHITAMLIIIVVDWVTERSRSNWVLVSLLDYKDYLTLTGQNLRILHQKILVNIHICMCKRWIPTGIGRGEIDNFLDSITNNRLLTNDDLKLGRMEKQYSYDK